MAVFAIFCYFTACGFNINKANTPLNINARQKNFVKHVVTGIVGTLLVNSKKVYAVQGKIVPASKEESKESVIQLKLAMSKMEDISNLAAKSEYQKIGDILSEKPFTNFDSLMNVLVRSQELSAEDKVYLGTIKR